MNFRRVLFSAAAVCMLAAFVVAGIGQAQTILTPVEKLGEFLYFDENLSDPDGQSCASCHHPDFGFADPDSNLPVSEGVVPGLFGGLNSPSAAYAMYAPVGFRDPVGGLWIGGQFWNGRATGLDLGDPLADQAAGPPTNPVEMANPDKATVIRDIKASAYANLFEQVWGEGSLDNVEAAYDQMALSIAAFERTALFAPFDSKYDYYLSTCLDMGGEMEECAVGKGKTAMQAGKKVFSQEEWKGMQLFMGENDNDGEMEKDEGAMCSACHIAEWTEASDYALNVQVPAWAPSGMVPPVFTDFTYDNLGVPQNTEFPLESVSPDTGLGGFLVDPLENGKFKVMTLRNIALTGPYGHNGYFKNLKDIVHFYNTRDVPGSMKKGMDWPMPEHADTVNFDELGNLGLNDKDEGYLVEFMKTLSDGYRP